jgi:pimeloyl-ACP methyl ester carboxylesterase
MLVLPVSGAELVVQDDGTGRPVIYAHGMLSSQRAEERLGLIDWSPVEHCRQLVRYDARAHGRSSGLPVSEHYDYEHFADDLLKVIDSVGAGQTVDIVGASLGAATALHAALRSSESIGRLVLLIPPRAWADRQAASQAYRGLATSMTLSDHAPGNVAVHRTRPPVLADIEGFPPPPDVAGYLLPHVLRGIADSDLPDRELLAGLPHPALVAGWEGDPAHPVETARELAALIPRARYYSIQTVADRRTLGHTIERFLEESHA